MVRRSLIYAVLKKAFRNKPMKPTSRTINRWFVLMGARNTRNMIREKVCGVLSEENWWGCTTRFPKLVPYI